jgi:hypothetical protein
VQLIFNTPNADSRPGYLKMGWSEVGSIGVLARPAIKRRGSSDDEIAGHYIRNVETFSGSPSDRPPRGLRTPRSESYLKWRYEGHPTARYTTVSTETALAFVRSNVRNGRRELVISDVMGADPRSAFRAVIKESTADYTVAWHGRGSPERRAAIAAGLFPVPGLKALTLVARPLADIPDATAGMSSWDFSIGDFELL